MYAEWTPRQHEIQRLLKMKDDHLDLLSKRCHWGDCVVEYDAEVAREQYKRLLSEMNLLEIEFEQEMEV